MPPLTYRPYERRTLENLLGAQGLSGGTAYDIFSGVQGSALDRLARQQALRMQRRQMATQAQQGFQQGLPGLAEFAVGMSQADVPSGVSSGVVGSVFGAYPDRFQGPLQDLIASAFPGTGSLADIGPQLDAEDLSGIDQLVTDANPTTAQTGDGTYHTALMSMLTRFKTLGYSPTTIEAARRYFDAVWKNAGGPEPTPTEASGGTPTSPTTSTGLLGSSGPFGQLADRFLPGTYSRG